MTVQSKVMLRSSENSKNSLLSIGDVAKRTGLAVSAIRFYESQGLVDSIRAGSGHRQFKRATIRRLSFIQVCQGLGYSLEEIGQQLKTLPNKRTPTNSDWEKLATAFADELDQRINGLKQLKAKLDGCIGCGCLSMNACSLYNNQDKASGLGSGPRYLLGDKPTKSQKN